MLEETARNGRFPGGDVVRQALDRAVLQTLTPPVVDLPLLYEP